MREQSWALYIMAAPLSDGVSFFKVGVSTDVITRLFSVQTGCPLPITRAWSMHVSGGKKEAFALEAWFHAQLEAWRSVGEWFKLCTNVAADRETMNATIRAAKERAGATNMVEMSRREIALALDARGVRRKLHRQQYKKRALAVMALSGRNQL